MAVTYQDIEAAAATLHHQAHLTPVMTSRLVNDRTKSQVFFKCENFQRTGSFKFRGAFNALANLPPDQKQRGVLTYSSGNHAQAIALAGTLIGVPTTIIMPHDAPAVKLTATQSYGAEVILYDRAETTREALAQQLSTERGAVVIPPFNHPHVIAGQGTAAKELFEAISETVGSLDLLLVCCGGGGLLSGCAITARALAPHCRVIGVEPEQGDDVTRSFHTRTLQTVYNPDTIADGARTHAPGSLTFPLILDYVDDMVTVSDQALLRTMFFLWERLKIVMEPTGALAATALLEGIVDATDARVGVMISGGNVDFDRVLDWRSV